MLRIECSYVRISAKKGIESFHAESPYVNKPAKARPFFTSGVLREGILKNGKLIPKTGSAPENQRYLKESTDCFRNRSGLEKRLPGHFAGHPVKFVMSRPEKSQNPASNL